MGAVIITIDWELWSTYTGIRTSEGGFTNVGQSAPTTVDARGNAKGHADALTQSNFLP